VISQYFIILLSGKSRANKQIHLDVNMAETLLASQLLKACARRRREIQQMETQMFFKKQNQSKKWFLVEMDEELDMAEAPGLCAVASKKERKERTQDEPRDSSWWRNGYRSWDDKAFKKRMRTNRATFIFILGEIRDQLVKEPTRFKPEPILLQTRNLPFVCIDSLMDVPTAQ